MNSYLPIHQSNTSNDGRWLTTNLNKARSLGGSAMSSGLGQYWAQLLASSVRRHHPPRQKLEFKASLIIRHYIDFIHYLHTISSHIRLSVTRSFQEDLLHTSGDDQVFPGRDTEEILLQ
ncbi:hypothetical protein IAS59_001653 [Cryptococcus gattii]